MIILLLECHVQEQSYFVVTINVIVDAVVVEVWNRWTFVRT